MARRQYRRKRKTNRAGVSILGLLLLIIVGWLGWSIVQGVNPLEVITAFKSSDEEKIPYDSLMTLYTNASTELEQANAELNQFKRGSVTKQVSIVNGNLNMRSDATTTGNIIEGIPSGTFVRVFYCSPDSSIIESQKGTWCKVEYNDNEGWVWSGYLK